jgi:hypothetical protein
VESKCWKKNPDLIPDKVKAARKKQAEKKSKKATAAVNDEMILILDRQEFDINDAFTSVPTDKSIVYLKNIYDNDDKPPVTASEPSKDGTYDLDLSPSAVANVIADTDFTTGAHVLNSPDIWIADTGATSHVTKHKDGGQKHHQTSVRTHGFASETIQPDCEMDIPVTYINKEWYGEIQCHPWRCSNE